MNPAKQIVVTATVGVLWVFSSGCVLGPAALQVSRSRYNEVIRETRTEQLLLNLVRLRYREEPLFLGVGSVAAQFSFRESADLAGTINEGPGSINPDVLDLRAGIGYEERPTITFAPLQGREFVRQLLSPLQPGVVVLLSQSGWSIDRVLRMTVQSMNGLDNAASASGPTPDRSPRYEEFARVCRSFRALQLNGMLELGYQPRQEEVSGPLPAEGISLPDLVEAVSRGYRLRPTEQGTNLVLTQPLQALVWRIPRLAREGTEVGEIVRLLGLKPGQESYEIRVGLVGQDSSAAEPGGRTTIAMVTRSLMGVLFYLSQAIEVPEPHRRAGFVTTTTDAEGIPFDWSRVTGNLLRVHCQKKPPRQAAVAVPHWGYWYYVDNSDLTSKSSLALLGQLFALQAGGAEIIAPVLTLPVGG